MTKLIDITGKALSGEWGVDDDTGNGTPVIRTTNFTYTGKIDYTNVITRTINKKNIAKKFLCKGDIIIEKSGGSDKFPVGRVVFFDGEENKYLFNNFTGLLRVKDKEKWFPKYVLYSLLSNYNRGGTRKFENKTTGLHNLKIDDYVNKCNIRDVDFNHQKDICNQLDKIDNIICKYKEEQYLLDELVKARFVEMFGDPVYNEKQWKVEQFGSLGEMKRGKSKHRPRNDPILLGGKYPLIQTGDISNSHIYIQTYKSTYSEEGLKQSKMWKAGTLCITIAANIAESAILTFDACFPDSVVGFLPNDKVNSIFIHQWLDFLQPILEENAPAVAQKNLNVATLEKVGIIVPPIELQNQFANFVKEVDKSRLEVQKSLKKTQELFDSLMQKYFG